MAATTTPHVGIFKTRRPFSNSSGFTHPLSLSLFISPYISLSLSLSLCLSLSLFLPLLLSLSLSLSFAGTLKCIRASFKSGKKLRIGAPQGTEAFFKIFGNLVRETYIVVIDNAVAIRLTTLKIIILEPVFFQ
jgi:hypothetical protein